MFLVLDSVSTTVLTNRRQKLDNSMLPTKKTLPVRIVHFTGDVAPATLYPLSVCCMHFLWAMRLK